MQSDGMATPISDTTICAISTPAGVGGIAIARVSGLKALDVVGRIWRGADLGAVRSHTAHLGTVLDNNGADLDQAVATVFRGPNSYTGEDVVELSVHGSMFVQRELLNALMGAGAVMAAPGEFTRRAFMAGRLDLAQAEAVADVIASSSRAAHRIAVSQLRGGFSRRLAQLREKLVELSALLELELDFSEEDVEFASRERLRDLAEDVRTEVSRLLRSFRSGSAIKEGIPVAIAGAVNAGKSSLLNALVGDDRAIVSNIPGTTRDTVEETVELGDYRFRFIDTAGLRHTDDTVERIGIERARTAMAKARIVIAVTDSTVGSDPELTAEISKLLAAQSEAPHIIRVLSKADLNPHSDNQSAQQMIPLTGDPEIAVSTVTGQGLDELRAALVAAARSETPTAEGDDVLVTNARHAQALAEALAAVSRFIDGLDSGLPTDLAAQDLRDTIQALATITGDIPSTEILTTIFSRFCIGK